MYPIQLTNDGGETWQKIEGGEEGLKVIHFINEREGWGYGNGIWHTDDCGLTWTESVSSQTFEGDYTRAYLLISPAILLVRMDRYGGLIMDRLGSK